MARINYVELPVRDTAASKAFYQRVFGFSFTDFGPTYAATTGGDVDLGLQGEPSEWTATLLPVIQVEDLDATLQAVTSSGGIVTMPIFDFPGGRRFHFKDPAGHEFAAMVPDVGG